MARVIAVVPSFSPDITLIDRLAGLASQVDSVLVVDDGSPAESAGVLQAIERAGYELLRNDANRGIAAALNSGIALALERGADFVLTVDQDSVLPAAYVAECLEVFALSATSTRIGIVCAESISDSPTIASEFTPEGFGLLRVAIQSGFLISAECLRHCGMFDERLFIDYVDTEYCLRITGFGYRIAAAPGTNIDHALGETLPLRVFGIRVLKAGVPVTFEYHGPSRRYYITRNGIDLALRYLRSMPRWVASNLRQEAGPLVKTLASGPHRGRLLLAIAVGTAHGVFRRRGPLTTRMRKRLTPR